MKIVKLERLDYLGLAVSYDDDDAVERQSWVAVIDDFVSVAEAFVRFEGGLAGGLGDDASGGDTVT